MPRNPSPASTIKTDKGRARPTQQGRAHSHHQHGNQQHEQSSLDQITLQPVKAFAGVHTLIIKDRTFYAARKPGEKTAALFPGRLHSRNQCAGPPACVPPRLCPGLPLIKASSLGGSLIPLRTEARSATRTNLTVLPFKNRQFAICGPGNPVPRIFPKTWNWPIRAFHQPDIWNQPQRYARKVLWR